MQNQSLNTMIEIFKNTNDVDHNNKVREITDTLEQHVLNKLAVFVAENRKESELTVRDLNERSMVSLAVINDLEKARSMPRVETLIRLGLALGINVNDVFKALLLPDLTINSYNKGSKTELATDLAKYGYDKNEVSDILNYIKYIDFKKRQKNNKASNHNKHQENNKTHNRTIKNN
ncbi:helix-turn-helix transcriptional regulator [bacterium]|nr:helix-turn-helix transcriptional regulator [bacterium]